MGDSFNSPVEISASIEDRSTRVRRRPGLAVVATLASLLAVATLAGCVENPGPIQPLPNGQAITVFGPVNANRVDQTGIVTLVPRPDAIANFMRREQRVTGIPNSESGLPLPFTVPAEVAAKIDGAVSFSPDMERMVVMRDEDAEDTDDPDSPIGAGQHDPLRVYDTTTWQVVRTADVYPTGVREPEIGRVHHRRTSVVWNPNGRELAVRLDPGAESVAVTIVSTEDPELDRVVDVPLVAEFAQHETSFYSSITLRDWSRTNRLLFVRMTELDTESGWYPQWQKANIYSASATTGATRSLASDLNHPDLDTMDMAISYSPNGKWVAYGVFNSDLWGTDAQLSYVWVVKDADSPQRLRYRLSEAMGGLAWI